MIKDYLEMMCPCESKKQYQECCYQFHFGQKKPETALKLMKSRYCAFVFHQMEYLKNTTHPLVAITMDHSQNQQFAQAVKFLKLEIINVTETSEEAQVEFKATFQELKSQKIFIHHELSDFHFIKGQWYYSSGQHF